MLGKLIILLIRQLKVIFAAKTKKTLKFHLLLCARTQADKVPSVWGIASQMAAVNLKMPTLQKAVHCFKNSNDDKEKFALKCSCVLCYFGVFVFFLAFLVYIKGTVMKVIFFLES